MAGRKGRICVIEGGNPGTRNRNLSFTEAEWDFIKGFADRAGLSPSLALVTALKRLAEAGQELQQEG